MPVALTRLTMMSSSVSSLSWHLCAGTAQVFSSADSSHGMESLLPSSWLRAATAAGDVLTVRLRIHHAAVHVRKPLPGLLLAEDPALVQISVQPRIVLLQNAITAAECQVLGQVTALAVVLGSRNSACVWSSRQLSHHAVYDTDSRADRVCVKCQHLTLRIT